MSILDPTSLIFTPGATEVGTIRFRDGTPLSQVKLVANVTRGELIYQFNSARIGAHALNEATNTITLKAETSTHDANDVLQAYVEDVLDPDGSTSIVGGIDPSGYTRRISVDATGKIVPSDGFTVTGARGSLGNVLLLDTTGYASVSVHVVGTSTSTVTFEASNDGTSWFAINGWLLSTASNTPTSSTASTGTYNAALAFPASMRYFRARISAYTSGTVVCIASLRTVQAFLPWSFPQVSIGAIAGAALVAEDAALGTTAFPIGGLIRTALPASTVIAGDAIRATFSRSAQYVTKENAPGDLDFYINTTTTGTAQVLLRAAQATDVRTNITSIIYQNTSATAATLTIQDGLATTLIQISVPASMTEPRQLVFPTPLRGSAATNLNYTQSAAASILLNVTGFNSY